jgi:hypothetical protein
MSPCWGQHPTSRASTLTHLKAASPTFSNWLCYRPTRLSQFNVPWIAFRRVL